MNLERVRNKNINKNKNKYKKLKIPVSFSFISNSHEVKVHRLDFLVRKESLFSQKKILALWGDY